MEEQLPVGRYARYGGVEPKEVYVIGPPDRWKRKPRSRRGEEPLYTLGTRATKKKYPLAHRPYGKQWRPDVFEPGDPYRKLVPWAEHQENVRQWEVKQEAFRKDARQLFDWLRARYDAVRDAVAPPLTIDGSFTFDPLTSMPASMLVTTVGFDVRCDYTLEEAEARLNLTPPPRPETDGTRYAGLDRDFTQVIDFEYLAHFEPYPKPAHNSTAHQKS